MRHTHAQSNYGRRKHVIIHVLKLSITKCKGSKETYICTTVHVIICVVELSKVPSDEYGDTKESSKEIVQKEACFVSQSQRIHTTQGELPYYVYYENN